MKSSEYIALIRELLSEQYSSMYTDDDILHALPDAVRRYSDDTLAFKDDFYIATELEFWQTAIPFDEIYWGVQRFIRYGEPVYTYNPPLLPPQPLSRPIKPPGYPPPLKYPPTTDFLFRYGFTDIMAYQYPFDFLQNVTGITGDCGYTIKPVNSSYIGNYQNDDFPRFLFDDLESDGRYNILPYKHLKGNIVVEDDDIYGIVEFIDGAEIEDGYGIIRGGFGIAEFVALVPAQGIMHYIRNADLGEISDSLAVAYYAAYRLLETRSEDEDHSRASFFRGMYETRISRYRNFEDHFVQGRKTRSHFC